MLRFFKYLIIVTVIPACTSIEVSRHEAMFDTVRGTERIVRDRIEYQVVFKPYGQWVDDVSGAVGIGYYKSPRLEVARVDGVALGRDQTELARQVALRACGRNPHWSIDGDFGPGVEIRDGFIAFMNLCA